MMRTVQLAVADAVYAAALRDALSRSGPWHVVSVERPDPSQSCVLVMDQENFARLPLPLAHPERVVLISRQDPQMLGQAWDAGIVSVASVEDPLATVLLAIMAASLRIGKCHEAIRTGGIPPNDDVVSAPLSPAGPNLRQKRIRT